MKIATVTVNPAIDQTVSVDHFEPGTVNRSQSMRFDAGGKGINVASALADYGLNVAVTGFLGEENAAIFERHFAAKKLDDQFIRIPGETRVNIKIIDTAERTTTDLNTPGQNPGSFALDTLYEKIESIMESCEWFVLSGNIRSGMSEAFYKDLITFLKSHDRLVLLDTSGAALVEGVKAEPNIIKPNQDELSALVGKSLENEKDVYEAASSLLSNDLRTVIVSMGSEGALFVEREQAFMTRPPQVEVKSTVGAGDAMVAGFVAGISQGKSLEECARLATVFSVSAVTHVGGSLSNASVLKQYEEEVTIIPM